jgi:xylan 1,4-beta-xylosidase
MAFNLVPLRRLPGNVPFVRERIRKGGSAMTCDPVRILVGCLAMHLMMSPGLGAEGSRSPRTWTADNGNGTFTNPLFFDEFSDPDLIRVGEDYYLTGTTMHAMPGLPVLHSRDLVNWRLLSYALERLDLGPEFRLEDGEIYGQGVWAPSFRYHDGTFHIFTNVNRHKTQHFHATNPAGPWTRSELGSSLHDLSVLFDDDGKVYVVWGYNGLQFAEMKPDLSDIKGETQRTLIPAGSGMGEGAHFYKIDGRYYIISANYDPVGYMVCARANRPEGPYEITTISAQETFGVGIGWRLRGMGRGEGFDLLPPQPSRMGAIPMHQGGIVRTPAGEWWGFSMMDHNSVGRLTCLSPVTWSDGWPYFGLPGNPLRTPRTWVKPRTEIPSEQSAPYRRDDDFTGPVLNPVWQWNHVPDDAKWSLDARPGFLRLESKPAESLWTARNTLTQRAVGPESIATAELDFSGLQPGDAAGLALLNHPYGWIGVTRTEAGATITQFDEVSGESATGALPAGTTRLWLRAACDFNQEVATFGFSTDGEEFAPLGRAFTMVFQLKTFQGVRFALFSYNTSGAAGGFADFDRFAVDEPQANGAGNRIPIGKVITLTSLADDTRLVAWNGLLRPMPPDAPEAATAAARFRVLDRGRGRVALQAEDGSGVVAVTGVGGLGDVRLLKSPDETASSYQWQDMLRDEVMLLSLVTHRHIHAQPNSGGLASADSPGASPGRREGSCFRWEEVSQ